jgi:hypothetical protein
MSRPFAVVLAALVLPLPATAQQRHPAEEQGIKSLESKIKTEMMLVNKTKQPVKVFWIDYKGKRKLDATLKPGEAHTVTTYLTHPWLVTDAKENAWAIFLPDAQPRTVDIVVPPKITPTSAYEKRTMHGFTVMIHPEVLRHEADAAEALKEMDKQLANIARVVPDGPLGHIRKVTVWLEWNTPGASAAQFHAPGAETMLRLKGLNPDKAGGVDVNHLRHFVKWSRIDQPWMILHEMAHAYHFRVLGEQHGGIRAAYKQAVERKLYVSVLGPNGKKEEAYALKNANEYFAELSEAYFGRNDFYPFTRAELEKHDPIGYQVMRDVWGEPVERR